MKIGATVISEDMDPLQLAEEFHKKEVNIIELQYNKKFTEKKIKRIKELNLDISVHCPNMRLKYPIWSFITKKPQLYFKRHQAKEFGKSLLVAEKLEATHYVMHGGGFPRGYSRFEWLKKKEKFPEVLTRDLKSFFMKAKDSGVKVLLENLMPFNIFGEISDIVYTQEKFPWTGFCLDFAHSELTKQTDTLKRFDIEHVHISDNDLINDSHLAIGEGKIDIFKLFKILRDKGYKRKIISEDQNISNAVKSVEKTKELLKNFQKVYK